MGWFDTFKDVLTVAQKADNVELIKQLLDLNNQALTMQEEIRQLKEENVELRKEKDLESRIIRHEEPYVTLRDETPEIRYCAVCWGVDKKLVQFYDNQRSCVICGARMRGR